MQLLDELVPILVFRTRDEHQIICSSVEALKKRKHRAYREYKKTNDLHFLQKSKKLTKKLKLLLKYKQKERIQAKAKSKDPRTFWSMVSELRNGKKERQEIEILNDGKICLDGAKVADLFGQFFINKVIKLSANTILEDTPTQFLKETRVTVSLNEVEEVGKSLSSKKSCGLDGMPMCVVKDRMPLLSALYTKLFNQVLQRGMLDTWRMARVIPLHKKGDKTDLNSYRPVSNLCSISKFYERIVLAKIN
jgi:hypothetical protein